MTPNNIPKWCAKGLLFENCNCSIICPCHVSFKQNATNERCTGYWAHKIARGFSRCIDRDYTLATEGTHAIYSNFSWKGP